MIVVGGAMLFPFSVSQLLSQDWSLPPLAVSAWVYSAIFPLLVTNLLYFRALRRIGAAGATLYMYLQPFLGALFAAILLGEQITALQVAGGAVIVLGVSLGQLMPGATVRE
jgi:drug/metabolite transporter (DMT)-like permease